jgi:hypothetical protein
MTLRFSPALQNFIAQTGSWKGALDNGSIEIYTGAQPATANLAPTGTLLVTVTSGAGAKIDEVRATGVITLSVGAVPSDTVTLITLAGLEIMGSTTAFNTSLTQTATDIALKINRNPKNKFVVATSSSTVITLTARPGFGVLLNAAALATGVGGDMVATVTSTTFGSGTGGSVAGVDAANGLRMDYNAAAGVMTKEVPQVWSGTAVGAGTQTAGWFRYKSSAADAGALDSSAVFMRMDGSIATAGADMNMSSTSITNGALQTLSSFSFTVPAV